MDSEQLVKIYLKMRKAKSENKRAYEKRDAEIEADMEVVQNLLSEILKRNKATSMKTTAGTFYKALDLKPSCNDWQAYHEWLIQRGDLGGLEKRVMKGFITTYAEENDGALPPGISTIETQTVRVRVGNE